MAGDDKSDLLAYRLEAVGADLQEIKTTMRDLAAAVQRLAVIEERQTVTNDAVGRAFSEIERVLKNQEALSARITRLELAQPIQAQTSDWVQRIVWLVVAFAIGAVLSGITVTRPSKATTMLPTSGLVEPRRTP